MPFNGAGVFSLVAGNPVVTGTIISSTWANSTLNDIAAALSMAVLKDGTQVFTSNLDLDNFEIINLGDGTTLLSAVNVKQLINNAYTWCGTAGGTANALTLTPAVAITAYTAGQAFTFKSGAAANSAATTVAVSGLTTKAIQNQGAALAAEDITENQWYRVTYDGAAFQLEQLALYTSGTTQNLTIGDTLNFIDGATITNLPDNVVNTNNLTEDVLNLFFSQSGSSGTGIASGDGRLSLATGVKVMTIDYTAKTTVYYVGSLVLLLNDGTGTFRSFNIGELSQALASSTFSPAATSASKAYDMFGWKDTLTVSSITRSGSTATVTTSGNHNITTGAIVYIEGAEQTEYNGYQTLLSGATNTFTFTVTGTPVTPATGTITAATARLSRGPAWKNAGHAITGATNATPIAITSVAHGLATGDSVEIAGVDGNTAANGVWTITVSTADVFTLTGSVGNGTYTAATGFFGSRGVGASTTQLTLVGATLTNTVAITNGPGAGLGTYIGSIYTNGSNQLDWKLGSIAAGGGPAYLSVWNVSNQVNFGLTVQTSTASWTYNSATPREYAGSTTFTATIFRGLNNSIIDARLNGHAANGVGTSGSCLLGINSTSVQFPRSVAGGIGGTGDAGTYVAFYSGFAGLGLETVVALEVSVGGTTTFYGSTAGYSAVPNQTATLQVNVLA